MKNINGLGVEKIKDIRKRLFIVTTLFTLAACGIGNETQENEKQEDLTSEVENDQQEDTTEDAQEDSEEETEQSNEESEDTNNETEITNAETSEFQWLLDELNGKSFIFSSGVGAWRTAFTFTDKGEFYGKYSDANGPEISVNEFEGQFDIIEEVDEVTYLLELVHIEVTSETGTEEADGDMTIVYVESPYGFDDGSDVFELYLPFKQKNEVTEDYLGWAYGQRNNEYEFLNSFGLYNRVHGYGMEELLN